MDTRYACALILALTAAWTASAQQLTTLIDNGDPSNRVDMIVLGDGYTNADLSAGLFDDHTEALIDYKFFSPEGGTGFSPGIADPFPRYRNFFNVHQITTVSQESGVDRPDDGVFVDTALGAGFTGDSGRLITVNNSLANAARDTALSGTGITSEMQYVTANTSRYGGSGGSYGVYAGANFNSLEIALHEIGHSFGRLADEYDYGGPTIYMGSEPSEPNVTTLPTGDKWSEWIGYDDPRGPNLDISVFQGARYSEQGLFRPSDNSKMRNLGEAFDAVSRQQLIHKIYDSVRPLDGHRSGGLLSEGALWVEVVDPAVIKTDWYIDDELACAACPGGFDPTSQGLSAGRYTVRAHVYDEVVKHAGTGGALDLVRTNLDRLQQEVEWEYVVIEPDYRFNSGDYNGDERIDAADYTVWRDALNDSVEPYIGADGDGSGVIDQGDYTHWVDRLGLSLQTATLIDRQTSNGSFEETGGLPMPRLVSSGATDLPGWAVETDKVGGWHNFVSEAASDGDNYLVTAGGATTTLTSDPLDGYLADEGDLFTLTFDAGTNDGAPAEFEAYLLFGDQEHLIGVATEDQKVLTEGHMTHTFDYVASPTDAGLSPTLRFVIRSGSDFSQAYLDDIRLDVDYWLADPSAPMAVPEPASLILLGLAGVAGTRRRVVTQ